MATPSNNFSPNVKMVRLILETVRKIYQHKCQLPIEDGAVNLRISEGALVPYRRSLWKWITVSTSNPDSKRFLKSAAQIQSEMIRHIDRHPHMVHPFSQARFVWEMVMVLVWTLLFTLIPIELSSYAVASVLAYMELTLQMVCWVDIGLWFFTGYYDEDNQTVVLEFKGVAKHYLRSYFVFDVVAALPVNFILCMADLEEYHYLSSVLLFKVVRLRTLMGYMRKFSQRTRILTSHIKFICFFSSLMFLLMWTVCMVYMLIKTLYPGKRVGQAVANIPLLMTAFRVTRFLMTVGVTDTVNTSNTIMIFEIVCIISGSILEIIIMAKVMQIYKKHSGSRYNILVEQIREYMKFKELPARLREKILKYVDFKFQKHIFRDEDVLQNLSSALKHEILLQRCQAMIGKVEFFKDLPPRAMMRIVNKLRSEIYLPSDVIVLEGYAGNAMYFIYMGTVAVYTGDGKEICHLEDGSHFGEIALLSKEPRVATVVAITECELFKLSRRDFQEAIEPFPELYKKIRLLAMKRLESTLQLMSEGKGEVSYQPEETVDESDFESF